MSRTIYSTRAEALTAFGQQALPLTGLDGRERCAALHAVSGGWRVGRIFRGTHNNVILPTLLLALCSLFSGPAELAHTHPCCACHAGEVFSGRRRAPGQKAMPGDALVPGLGRLRAICLVAPSGTMLRMDKSGRVEPLGRLTDSDGRPMRLTRRCSSRFHGQLPVMKDPIVKMR